MNLRRTSAVARKEFFHILRDARSLFMALVQPLVLLVLFGYALTLDVDRIPTLIYDADRSAESRELIQRFLGSRYFQILGFVDDYKPIERKIDRDECLLAVVIPTDYSKKLLAGRVAEVQLLLDGSDSNTASVALGYTEALLQGYAMDVRSNAMVRRGGQVMKPPVVAGVRIWYNSELKSKNYIVPGLIAIILMLIASSLTSLTIAREWEMGTMEQLLSTPVRPKELVLGKLVAYFALGLVDMLIALVVGLFVFQVPMRGNPLLLFFTSCVFLFGALSWGILVSALARNQLMAYQMGTLTSFLPAFLLSGFIFAVENMPTAIRVITYVVPTRYFVTVLKGIFLKGVGMRILWMEIGLLMAFAGVVFFLATRKLNQKIA